MPLPAFPPATGSDRGPDRPQGGTSTTRRHKYQSRMAVGPSRLPRIAAMVGAVLHEPAFRHVAEVVRIPSTPAAQRGNRHNRGNARRNDDPHGMTSSAIVCGLRSDGCAVLNRFARSARRMVKESTFSRHLRTVQRLRRDGEASNGIREGRPKALYPYRLFRNHAIQQVRSGQPPGGCRCVSSLDRCPRRARMALRRRHHALSTRLSPEKCHELPAQGCVARVTPCGHFLRTLVGGSRVGVRFRHRVHVVGYDRACAESAQSRQLQADRGRCDDCAARP